MKTFYNQLLITHALALRMLEITVKKADQLDIKINAAIMDTGGILKAFIRMDDAPLLSAEIAKNKAYTAVAFGMPTSEWYPMIKSDPALLHGIVHTERLIIFGGGLPIRHNKQLIGGIGVSGGSAEQDVLCAEAALSAVYQ